MFIFTEPAETVNAEKAGIPKETAKATEAAVEEYAVPITEEPAETALADEAGLIFKSAKTVPIADGKVINPYSGGELVKSETLGVWKTHDGADIAAPLGTAVSAMMKGTVTEVKNDPLWGVSVTIDHGDGVVGYYSNLDTNVSVKAGQEVAMGEIIGQVGNTADASAKSYNVGDTVKHKSFGTGVILSCKPMGNDVLMEVAFDKAGTKKMMANFARLEKV